MGIEAGYPMVAASYAAQRSAIAKSHGLGREAAVIPPTRNSAKPK
ncbi:MucR family transcriptional regulator [Mesorhizobium sp. VK22B]|uniref:MucR family transcriptional regulator n=1 Tax=Mesorhizobium captivum TaxID=3072319 RepID=A0ABU4ZAI2_9HYPH|nr:MULTISPECIES: MucR family transcriptional regulator [unclassified Mesorhizobium]MDX8495305.1 MucR family transcriptional regulator [Mesorhizobium sp. VK22B]MDX8508712.1 MucR family transcriptional regulator [Mesorhizobium sp. VK22E]